MYSFLQDSNKDVVHNNGNNNNNDENNNNNYTDSKWSESSCGEDFLK